MKSLEYRLVADGTSDRCLIRIIDWLLGTLPETCDIVCRGEAADFGGLRRPPRSLAARARHAIQSGSCDILFVHRDAEREPRIKRVAEIEAAVPRSSRGLHVPIVPVRMTEAWLLIDETAIRCAADNPNGDVRLCLPPVSALEHVPDPKRLLEELLLAASGKSPHRLARFKQNLNIRTQRVADLLRDFSPLRRLPAFLAFEADTRLAVAKIINIK
jgi:hypothetical protein